MYHTTLTTRIRSFRQYRIGFIAFCRNIFVECGEASCRCRLRNRMWAAHFDKKSIKVTKFAIFCTLMIAIAMAAITVGIALVALALIMAGLVSLGFQLAKAFGLATDVSPEQSIKIKPVTVQTKAQTRKRLAKMPDVTPVAMAAAAQTCNPPKAVATRKQRRKANSKPKTRPTVAITPLPSSANLAEMPHDKLLALCKERKLGVNRRYGCKALVAALEKSRS